MGDGGDGHRELLLLAQPLEGLPRELDRELVLRAGSEGERGLRAGTLTSRFFEARTAPGPIFTPANFGIGGGGEGSATNTFAVAVAERPVESVTVTVPKWTPEFENVRPNVAPGPPPPSSNVQS
jgi:hypothetical protein